MRTYKAGEYALIKNMIIDSSVSRNKLELIDYFTVGAGKDLDINSEPYASVNDDGNLLSFAIMQRAHDAALWLINNTNIDVTKENSEKKSPLLILLEMVPSRKIIPISTVKALLKKLKKGNSILPPNVLECARNLLTYMQAYTKTTKNENIIFWCNEILRYNSEYGTYQRTQTSSSSASSSPSNIALDPFIALTQYTTTTVPTVSSSSSSAVSPIHPNLTSKKESKKRILTSPILSDKETYKYVKFSPVDVSPFKEQKSIDTTSTKECYDKPNLKFISLEDDYQAALKTSVQIANQRQLTSCVQKIENTILENLVVSKELRIFAEKITKTMDNYNAAIIEYNSLKDNVGNDTALTPDTKERLIALQSKILNDQREFTTNLDILNTYKDYFPEFLVSIASMAQIPQPFTPIDEQMDNPEYNNTNTTFNNKNTL
jgi:hypothetical protein